MDVPASVAMLIEKLHLSCIGCAVARIVSVASLLLIDRHWKCTTENSLIAHHRARSAGPPFTRIMFMTRCAPHVIFIIHLFGPSNW